MAIFDEYSIRLTPEEEQATNLPAEFDWQQAGSKYHEMQALIQETREDIRELTGDPDLRVQAMQELAVRQYRLCYLIDSLFNAMIARADDQLKLGGIFTTYATCHQPPH